MSIVTLTHDASEFKRLFFLLKDVLNDVHLHFKASGVYITALDPLKTSIVEVAIENCHIYKCDKELLFGVNMDDLYRSLRSCSNGSTLEINVFDTEPDPHMELVISSELCKSTVHMKSLRFDTENLMIPDMNYPNIVDLKVSGLMAMLKQLSSVSKYVSIAPGESLWMQSESPTGTHTIFLHPNGDKLTWVKNNLTETASCTDGSNTYLVKFIERFLKKEFCPIITLHLGYQAPLKMTYKTSVFYVSLYLAPVKLEKE
jgi:proliferating cell nuclear antigen PCNA